jgi:hypothetical protein
VRANCLDHVSAMSPEQRPSGAADSARAATNFSPGAGAHVRAGLIASLSAAYGQSQRHRDLEVCGYQFKDGLPRTSRGSGWGKVV